MEKQNNRFYILFGPIQYV